MISLLLLAATLQATAGADGPVLSRQVFLMGTQATLWARNASRSEGLADLDVLLTSLEASEDALSTWRDTPFNRLNVLPEGHATKLDPSLCRLITDLTTWSLRTRGAFDPAVGPLLTAWGVQTNARVPSDRQVRELRHSSRLASWRFDETACTLARPHLGRLDSGGFGKGAALDRAAIAGLRGSAWMVDLGGQVAVGGALGREAGWRVAIAHPFDRTDALFEVALRTGSLATSAGSERDQLAGGMRVGHILDPRTGMPASFNGSVVVWHERAFVADVVSTALYVMGTEEGLQWAEKNRMAACFLVPEGSRVRIRPTSAFTRHFRVHASLR